MVAKSRLEQAQTAIVSKARTMERLEAGASNLKLLMDLGVIVAEVRALSTVVLFFC